ncbi:sterol-binding protein [Chitinimonas arctica]|uniref:Ubiquinone biosynthesis accessory factor UbiJ n=1 Tax=Chitinimonas arctica TaxID=2594795 RepID=A0A516SE77_9NEIS|nr:SCP2 sterol-binding domain-containing protein [Chitinimonas arctica]QDQ26466.1 sterol-binding protein [Chitinimonas arctica]
MLHEAVLNHLLNQRADLRAELAVHAGSTVRLGVPPFRFDFQVGQDGLMLPGRAGPDATIDINPWLLPRLALHDPAAERELRISGDTQLAAAVGRVLQALDWDIEADMARVLGDISAHRLASLGRDLVGDPRLIARNLAETAAEYLREEAQLLATRPAVEHFNRAVDHLRDDVARLEKRIGQREMVAP